MVMLRLTIFLLGLIVAIESSSSNLSRNSNSEYSIVLNKNVPKATNAISILPIYSAQLTINTTLPNLIETNNNFDKIIKFLICSTFLIICFACIFGNILVILSVFTYRPLQNVQNIFIVSLAVADTFVAIFVMPFHVSYFLSNGKWLFGAFVCHFFLTLDILLCTSSTLHLCCIALDRYWAIKDSIKYAQKRTFKRVMIMITIAWLLSALISLPVIIWNMKTVRSAHSDANSDLILNDFEAQNSTVTNSEIVCDIPHDKLYRFYSSSGTFFVPLLIMTFVYVRIYLETKRRLHERAKAAKKLAKSVANSSSTAPNLNRKNKMSLKRLNKMTYFKCWCNCIENNKDVDKVNDNENIGAYYNEESQFGEYVTSNKKLLFSDIVQNQEEAKANECIKDNNIVFKSNAESDDSNQQTNQSESREEKTNKTITKVSIGTNTVQNENNSEIKEKTKKTEFILDNPGSAKNKSSLNNSSTWTRNPANSGTTLKQRQKISLTRERRAARTLGIIMGAFIICWFPFFIVYLLQAFDYFTNGYGLFEFLTWLGYVNSALNPIIYTIFNIDFRKSFERILFKCILCKSR